VQQHARPGISALHEAVGTPGKAAQCRNQSDAISAIASRADTPCQNRTGERS
jgi:hypothetical protein